MTKLEVALIIYLVILLVLWIRAEARCSYYKGYFDQKQRNRKALEGITDPREKLRVLLSLREKTR